MGKKGGNTVLEDLTNGLVQYATVGLVGMEDGKIKKGFVTKQAGEFLGEVTGSNAARAQMNKAEQQVQAEAAKNEQERLNMLVRNERADRQASSGAAAMRASGASRATATPSPITGLSSMSEQDFLGL